MAIPVITLVNQTVSAINLLQLGLLVPGSGSIAATGPAGSVTVSDVLNDPQLHTEVDGGNITVMVDGDALTVDQSSVWILPQRELAALKHNFTAVVAPTTANDENDGYSIGSFWGDTAGGTFYRCFDASVGAAVWTKVAQTGVDVSAHAPRHLPSGADPISTATAVEITDSTNGPGTANSLVRSDHVHAHGNRGGGTLHAAATISVAGFMTAADKTKLDGLGAAIASSVITSTSASTTSATFQDAFTGQNITLTDAGDYLIMFDTNVSSSTAAGVPEIGISVNGVVLTDSQRFVQGNGGANVSAFTHTIVVSLLVGDVITGVFRRSSGSGTTSVNNRRFTVIRVNQ